MNNNATIMKKFCFLFINSLFLVSGIFAGETEYTKGLFIWFDTPNVVEEHTAWESQSLPIGNGSLGANIIGSVDTERITFNEKTLWRGGPNTAKGAEYYWNVNKHSAHVGDAIVKAFGNIQRLRKKTSAKSWLMQILVNSAHDIVRKRSKWKIVEKQLDDTAVTEAFESDEMLPIVMELKEEFREIIILYYYEEFSVGEISRMLKIPTGTVKSRLARGRDKLSTIL